MLRMPSMPLQSLFLISSTTAAVLLPPQYLELYQSLERLIIYRTIGLKRSNEGNTKAPKYILCHNLNKQNRWQKYTIISILQNKIAIFFQDCTIFENILYYYTIFHVFLVTLQSF